MARVLTNENAYVVWETEHSSMPPWEPPVEYLIFVRPWSAPPPKGAALCVVADTFAEACDYADSRAKMKPYGSKTVTVLVDY